MEASAPTGGPSPTPTLLALPPLPSGPTQAQAQAQAQLPFPASSSVPPRTPQPQPQPQPPTPQPMAASGDNQSSSFFLERREEGLLQEVLEELDRERSKRAELEAQVRTLDDQVQAYRRLQREEQQQQQQQKGAKSPSSGLLLPTRQEYAALESERRGYLELLEALTNNQPSFRTAAEAELLASSSSSSSSSMSNRVRTTLPLHVVRLLEIMPWDERTQPHLFGQEQVYEWQIWSAQKTWQPELRFFPTVFKTIPIVLPQPGQIVQEGLSSSTTPRRGGSGFATVGAMTSRSNVVAALLKGAAGSAMAPPKQCVLTNLTVTQILNIDHGYPLPQDGGTWQWIGGWRIERNMDTDLQGWSYSNSVTLYSTSGASGASSTTSTTSTDFTSEFVLPKPGTPNIIKRRRKWTRTRVLVDYPHASTSSREYLKLVAQRASLMVSVEKLSEQLVETKMKLTTLEEDHHALREQATRAVSQLGKDHLNDREELQILLTALQETLEHQEQQQENDGDFKQVPPSTAPAASMASMTQALTRQLGDRLGTLSSTSSVGTGSASNANTANAINSASTTTTSNSSTTTTNSNHTTQQVMDWTKGQGSQLLEKLKQSGAKEQTNQILEKLKNSGASDWTKDQGNQLLTKVFKPKKTSFVQPSSVASSTTATAPATTATTIAASAASSLVNSLPWSRSHHRHNSSVSSSSSQDHAPPGETYGKGTPKDVTTIPETVLSSSSLSLNSPPTEQGNGK